MAKNTNKQWEEWAEKVKTKRQTFDQTLTDKEKKLLVKVAKETGQDCWFSIDSEGKFFDKSRECYDTFYMSTNLLANGVTPDIYSNFTQEEKVIYDNLINKL